MTQNCLSTWERSCGTIHTGYLIPARMGLWVASRVNHHDATHFHPGSLPLWRSSGLGLGSGSLDSQTFRFPGYLVPWFPACLSARWDSLQLWFLHSTLPKRLPRPSRPTPIDRQARYQTRGTPYRRLMQLQYIIRQTRETFYQTRPCCRTRLLLRIQLSGNLFCFFLPASSKSSKLH